MRVAITATSECLKAPLIIEADLIDDVLTKLRDGEIDITSLVDLRYSDLCENGVVVKSPKEFVVGFEESEDYDVEIEIYDNWRE